MVQPGLLLGNGLLLIFGIFCNLVSYLVLVFYSVVKSNMSLLWFLQQFVMFMTQKYVKIAAEMSFGILGNEFQHLGNEFPHFFGNEF